MGRQQPKAPRDTPKKKNSPLKAVKKRLSAVRPPVSAQEAPTAPPSSGQSTARDAGMLQDGRLGQTSPVEVAREPATSNVAETVSVLASLGDPGLPGSRSSLGPSSSSRLSLPIVSISMPMSSSAGNGTSSSNLLKKAPRDSDKDTRALETRVEELLVAGGRPSEIADAFADLGEMQLLKQFYARSIESFAFCLSYSTVKRQARAYLGVAKARFALAKKQSKSKRAKTRDEALEAAEAALLLAQRFHGGSTLEEETKILVEAINALPFKVSV